MNYRLVTIVLAAGESRRMGQPKLFLPLQGSTMLRLAVTAALSLPSPNRVVVVSGAYADEISTHLADYELVLHAYNHRWKTGMASSIAAGLTLAATLHPTHVFVTLADQPTVGQESLAILYAESQQYPQQIVATQYPERPGVPAIFPIRFAEELRAQSGTFGARQLIAREGDQVRTITFAEPPIDVDTPEEYARLRNEDGPG